MSVTGKRLEWVERTFRRDPRVYARTVYQAASMIMGDDGDNPDRGAMSPHEWRRWIEQQERAGAPPPRGVKYLPWFAVKVSGVYKEGVDVAVRLQQLRRAFPRIVDWATSTKADINKLSFLDARAAAEAWHAEAATRQAVLTDKQQGVVVHRFADGWTIQQLGGPLVSARRDSKLLIWEGEAMGNCVGGYHADVRSGQLQIYSLRDPKGQPHATISLKRKPSARTKVKPPFVAVDEVAGRADVILKRPYRRKINAWLDTIEFIAEKAVRRGHLALDRLGDLYEQEDTSSAVNDTIWHTESGVWAPPLIFHAEVEVETDDDDETHVIINSDARMDRDDWDLLVNESREPMIEALRTHPALRQIRVPQGELPGVGVVTLLSEYEEYLGVDLRGFLSDAIEEQLARDPKTWHQQPSSIDDPVVFDHRITVSPERVPPRQRRELLNVRGSSALDLGRTWQLELKARIDQVRAEAADLETKWVQGAIDSALAEARKARQ